MNRKQLLLAAAIGLACAPLWATDYYVSPAGSGSKYTLEAPGPFTSTVIGKLKAGDNLKIPAKGSKSSAKAKGTSKKSGSKATSAKRSTNNSATSGKKSHRRR